MKNNNLKQLLKEIKCKSFIYWQKICENDKETEIKVKLGKIKDMSKEKVTLSMLYDTMVEFKQETISRLDRLETRVENIEKDVALIKSCPTIKKELNELQLTK